MRLLATAPPLMPDYSGPIQAVELARWLWLIPFFPLLGALTNALYASGLLPRIMASPGSDPDPEGDRGSAPVSVGPAFAARVTVLALAASALSSVSYAWALFRETSSHRFLLQHLWQLVRVGPVDAGVDLALDPISAILAAGVTIAGTLVCLDAQRSDDRSDVPAWAFFARVLAIVFFLLMILMADNALLLLFGWQGLGLVGIGLLDPSGSTAKPSIGVERVGDAALWLGIVLLFWALGGSWSSRGDYQPDLLPRVFAVTPTEPGAPRTPTVSLPWGRGATQGQGFLSVTGLPDSLVYADDSRIPTLDAGGLPLRTPFVDHPVSGGVHSYRLAPDDDFRAGVHDGRLPFALEAGVLPSYATPRFAFGGDRAVALVVVGPTLRFRELRDQMLLADEAGNRPVRDRLVAGKNSGGRGVLVLGVVCLTLLLGILAKLASGVNSIRTTLGAAGTRASSPSSALAVRASGAAMVLASAYLLLRLGFVFALLPIAAHGGSP